MDGVSTVTAAALSSPKASRLAGIRSIAGFTLRRLLSTAVVIVIVTVVVFAFMHAAPGGPERAIAGRFATPEQLAAIRAEYRLDDPLLVQYGHFLANALHLHFGTSYSTREPVTTSMLRAASTTVPLVLVSWSAALALGTALGVMAARRAGSALDRCVLALTVVGASSPVFATAILLSYIFGVRLGWFPTLGEGQGGADQIAHLALPALTLIIAALASFAKVTKVRVEQVLAEDHVTFAVARGLPSRKVLTGGILRNAGVQLVTQAGAVMVALIAADILVEEVFDLDGLGALLMQAIDARDIPLIQAITLFTALFIVAVNLAVDLVCLAIDPRLRTNAGRTA